MSDLMAKVRALAGGYSRLLAYFVNDLHKAAEGTYTAHTVGKDGITQMVASTPALFDSDVIPHFDPVRHLGVVVTFTTSDVPSPFRAVSLDRHQALLEELKVAGIPVIDFVLIQATRSRPSFYSFRLEGLLAD